MTIGQDDDILQLLDSMDAAEADRFATEMDDIVMDMDELNPEVCPPDRRFFRGDREAWVYEHGNIAELVFVKSV
ncbi:MAG: hypothetical protein AAF423_08660 [Pseudomonadota bacterium]